MATHSGIRDDGMKFQIVPSTRKITVPASHKVIGTVGDHNSEQITFQCPKAIDGHDVVNCAEHYVIYKNASGITNRVDIPSDNITTDDENMYLTWVIDSGVTAAAGFVSFAVYFVDKDEDNNIIYRWGTTTCKDCQILDAIINDNQADGTIPDGYLKPEGTVEITANGTHYVAAYEYADVNVAGGGEGIPDGYIRPTGTVEITENGTHDVLGYASADVNVPVPTLIGTTITTNGTHEAPDGHAYQLVTVEVQPVLQVKEATANGDVIPDDGYDGLSKVTVNVPREAVLQRKTVDVTSNGEMVVECDEGNDGLSAVVLNVDVPTDDSPLPIEVATEAEMNAILEASTSATVGSVYKYTGESTFTYDSGALYIVGVE